MWDADPALGRWQGRVHREPLSVALVGEARASGGEAAARRGAVAQRSRSRSGAVSTASSARRRGYFCGRNLRAESGHGSRGLPSWSSVLGRRIKTTPPTASTAAKHTRTRPTCKPPSSLRPGPRHTSPIKPSTLAKTMRATPVTFLATLGDPVMSSARSELPVPLSNATPTGTLFRQTAAKRRRLVRVAGGCALSLALVESSPQSSPHTRSDQSTCGHEGGDGKEPNPHSGYDIGVGTGQVEYARNQYAYQYACDEADSETHYKADTAHPAIKSL